MFCQNCGSPSLIHKLHACKTSKPTALSSFAGSQSEDTDQTTKAQTRRGKFRVVWPGQAYTCLALTHLMKIPANSSFNACQLNGKLGIEKTVLVRAGPPFIGSRSFRGEEHQSSENRNPKVYLSQDARKWFLLCPQGKQPLANPWRPQI